MTTKTLKFSQRLIFFVGIGSASALINIGIVFIMVSLWQINPLIANIFGFLVAFNCSYFGHKYLTFSKLHDSKQLSLPHFFMVACSGGILNESLYFLFLRYTTLNYLLALILVLGLVSLYTYILSRFWACR